ncbi:hypothetical protein D3C81_1885900 [compost metagenome]
MGRVFLADLVRLDPADMQPLFIPDPGELLGPDRRVLDRAHHRVLEQADLFGPRQADSVRNKLLDNGVFHARDRHHRRQQRAQSSTCRRLCRPGDLPVLSCSIKTGDAGC